MTACLPPWEVPMLPDEPFVVNRPVRITGSLPAAGFIQTGNGAGCTLTFEVQVADPDIDDTLRVRWYVDYNPDTNPGFKKEAKFQNTNSEERQPPGDLERFRSNVEQVIDPLHAPTSPGAPHIVEAVVFDGTIDANREPELLAPPPYADAGFQHWSTVAIQRWAVETIDGQPCQ